jgi:outer membrane lipoprotein-sorting protein
MRVIGKKYPFLFLLLPLLLLFACSKNLNDTNSIETPAEKVTSQIDSATGDKYFISKYPNGNIEEEGWFKAGGKSGYWKRYYENSVLKEGGHYLSGLKNDWWEEFNEQGEIL